MHVPDFRYGLKAPSIFVKNILLDLETRIAEKDKTYSITMFYILSGNTILLI